MSTSPATSPGPRVDLSAARAEAEALLASVPDGPGLDAEVESLIRLGVNASVCTLDGAGMSAAITDALDAGASRDQVHEVLVVVSALGVHTLMEGSRQLSAVLRERGFPVGPADSERSALQERLRGSSSYWAGFEREVPGFLDALLEHSPEAYEAFFAYCAVPWRTGAVAAEVKELVSMACDATPTHRYLPGLRLHLANAVRLGVRRTAIREALDVAATAPPHPGIPSAG